MHLALEILYLYLSSISRVAQVLYKMLWHLDMLLKESVDWKINTSIWFYCLKIPIEDKGEKQGAEAPHLSEPQKAHPFDCCAIKLHLYNALFSV